MSGRRAHQKGPRLGALTATLSAAVVVSVLGIVGWNLSGGRLLAMTTPSMCPTVCVGSLVGIEPLTGPVHVGELVTFHPPGVIGVFTHRVVKVEANGSFTTKGDAETSPDPWIISPSEVIGRVSFTDFGLGWWLRALPMVTMGTLFLLFARRFIRLRNRRSFERLFGTMVVVLPLLRLHPLLNGQLVQAVADPRHHGWFKGLVINTGLLPSQIHVKGGTVLSHLAASQLHWVAGPSVQGMDLSIHQSASLPIWGWGFVLAGMLWPMLGFLAYRLRTEVEVEDECAPVPSELPAGDIGHHERTGLQSGLGATDDMVEDLLRSLAQEDELQPSG